MKTRIIEIPLCEYPDCQVYEGKDGSIYLPGYSQELGDVWVKLRPNGQRAQVFSDRPLLSIKRRLRIGTEIQIMV